MTASISDWAISSEAPSVGAADLLAGPRWPTKRGPARRFAARVFVLVLGLALMGPGAAAEEVYQRPEDFLREIFAGDPPAPEILPIAGETKSEAESILGHRLGVSRLRYWGRDQRTAWILEEIGKERPITTGIVVARDRIERVKVLIYRESRGFEVRYPVFTDQFTGAALAADGDLTKEIDGISGATLSVRALTRLARLALFLHSRTPYAGD